VGGGGKQVPDVHPGGRCLELLLLFEAAGRFPWAQQQLQPLRAVLSETVQPPPM
jgi:hypothetical protein